MIPVAGPGEGPDSPFFLDQTEAQRGRKNFLRPPPPPISGSGCPTPPPPPLSEGLDPESAAGFHQDPILWCLIHCPLVKFFIYRENLNGNFS